MPGPFSMRSSTFKMERGDEKCGEKSFRERNYEAGAGNGGEAAATSISAIAGGGGGGGAPPPPPTTTTRDAGLDSQLWHACAGAMVHLPHVGDKVIYFPQGHSEHAASLPDFPRNFSLSSTIPCRVVSLNFLADKETDEVYSRIRLQPDPSAAAPDPSSPHDSPPSPSLPEKSTSFAKTLTQSDANNGGGFSVPRYCAETIFPRLDYTEDPPVQMVLAKDVHGTVWKFRHIYRGTPRRHLLTTGWSNFVNQKKLVAGDAIVFLRSSSGELCVGVRRSTRGNGGVGDSSAWHLSGVSAASIPPDRSSSRWEVKPLKSPYDFLGSTDSAAGFNRVMRPGADIVTTTTNNNFARNRARVTAKSVLEAATLAAAGQAFEVVYYPRATISEFCVKAHVVRAALQQSWGPGMRFKMAVETEDASRISWFMGTVSKVQEADPILWPGSPWKILQVAWDEPDLLQGISRVSPWQVELVSPMQLPPFSLPKKKVRLSQPPDFQIDGQGIMGFTMAALASNMLGHINPWHGFGDSFPAGMQGARHDGSYGLTLQDFRLNRSQPGLSLDNICHLQEHPVLGGARVSTELNMGNFAHQGRPSMQDNLSALLAVANSSHSEPASSSNVLSQGGGGSSSSKSGTFVLFGKAIDTSQLVRSQQPQLSGGSSSDGQGHETLSDGNRPEGLAKRPRFLSSYGNGSQAGEAPSLLLQQGQSLESACDGVHALKWLKEQATFSDGERVTDLDNGFNHCKIFRENEDVGRTVDLSSFNSYEELCDRLGKMFGIEKSEVLSRVVSVDSMGSSRPVGDELYRDFMKKVKRLRVLSKSSSESMSN